MDKYLEYCEINKNLSPQTIAVYRRVISDFMSLSQKKDIEDISLDDVTNYIKNLKNKSIGDSTIKLHLIVIKTMLKKMKKNGVKCLDSDFIDLPKVAEKQRQICSVDDLNKVFEQIKGNRNKAIFEVIRSSGMRISEVIGLKVSDIKNDEITITGKGSKVRLVFISDLAVKLINQYLSERNFTSEWLFCGKTGKKHVSRVMVERFVKEAGDRVGIKIYPHMLRHVFATSMLKNGCRIQDVQSMLGHSSLDTTAIYLHLTNDYLKDVWKKGTRRS